MMVWAPAVGRQWVIAAAALLFDRAPILLLVVATGSREAGAFCARAGTVSNEKRCDVYLNNAY
jgi:hypothetical protein